jgi:hypothetical protein
MSTFCYQVGTQPSRASGLRLSTAEFVDQQSAYAQSRDEYILLECRYPSEQSRQDSKTSAVEVMSGSTLELHPREGGVHLVGMQVSKRTASERVQSQPQNSRISKAPRLRPRC